MTKWRIVVFKKREYIPSVRPRGDFWLFFVFCDAVDRLSGRAPIMTSFNIFVYLLCSVLTRNVFPCILRMS